MSVVVLAMRMFMLVGVVRMIVGMLMTVMIMMPVIGVVVLWLAFIVIDKLTPYHLWDQLVKEKNVALAIVVGAMFIALGMIIAAAIHG